jgi:hypothetical protein
MGILSSFKWFRSEKEKELEQLRVDEQQMKNELLEGELSRKAEEQHLRIYKPYKKLKLVNDVLIIVLNDGNILTKPGATKDDFNNARISKTEVELFTIASGAGVQENRQKEKQIEKVKTIIKGIETLKGIEDFVVEENTVYLKGTNRSLPQLLIEKFAEIVESNKTVDTSLEGNDEYIALKRFFLWCCLNPRAEVTDKLYDFLAKNGMKITKQGFFVGLRNVVTVEGGDHKLVDFITNTYQKVKAVWKKKPSAYTVWKLDDGTYTFEKGDGTGGGINKRIGNLEELYLKLPEMKENRYTDDRTKTFDIRVGQKVFMKPEDCSWSTADCGERGLHFAGHTAPYVLCGNTTVFTLHNPMKVVAIGDVKGRCYEYLPFMTTTVSEAAEIMTSKEFDFLQLDEQYAIEELEGLTEKVKEGFAIEAKKHSFNIPQISSVEIDNIVNSLEDMKKSLSKRVVEM